MWFSWCIGPLGPSIRKHHVALYDLDNSISKEKLNDLKKLLFFTAEVMDLNEISNSMCLAYLDPDSIDRAKTSKLNKAIILVYG